MMNKIIFIYFAVVILGSAILTITRRNPVHSVMFMLLLFFHIAGLFVLLNAEFLAAWRQGMATVLANSMSATAARPRVLIMHFGQINNSYLAVKRGTPADRMIGWAGGVNAVDSVGGMLRLTPELIAMLYW